MADWWDEFSNNLATDLAPLISLLGESPTKQYLSECLNFTDFIIFSTAPIGIITAVISAIRVGGSPSLRAFIGRAQEGGGNAEAELCCSTSRDVCELYNNGGIARVFGRPMLLEIVLDQQPVVGDFYKKSDGTPQSAGIYFFSEYIDHLQDVQDRRGGKPKTKQSIGVGGTSSPKSLGKEKYEKKIQQHWDWVDVKGYHTDGSNKDMEANSKKRTGEHFPPNPNLSLNVGIRKLSYKWFATTAVLGVVLQSAVLVWAAIARYQLQFVRSGPTDKYAVPMTIIGTMSLAFGMALCAFLVKNNTRERVFKRKEIRSHMYWLQPGNQYVGDQAFDSFAFSDRGKPLTKYISSMKNPNTITAKFGLVWTAIGLTTLGFIMQFLGLRACHSSVAVAQLGVMIVMSVFRALLRTQRFRQEDNCMALRPDAFVSHELDWLALYMDSKDLKHGIKPPTKHSNTSEVLDWKRISSAAFTWSDGEDLAQILSIKQHSVLPESPKPDVKEGLVAGFEVEDDKSIEWLKVVYSSGVDPAKESLPHAWSRRFLYRSRLARMTNDWNDNYVATRDIARRLAQAITETANILTADATIKEGWKKVKVFYWPIQSRLPRGSCSIGDDSRGDLFYLALSRDHSEIQSSAWTVDESELEAVLGLWTWTLTEQITGIHPDRPDILRILSTKSSDAYDLNLWREPGGIPITKEIPRRPSLLCGLHNLSSTPSDGMVQALAVKGAIPKVCAQELYSVFFLAILDAAVENIGGETKVRERLGTFMLKNTTISSAQETFTKNALGSVDDAFACTIPALISSAKLSSFLNTLADARKAAEQFIKAKKWNEAERLLRWSIKQCRKSKKPDGPDSAFNFENDQRLLILAMCECYRKSLLAQGSSDFGIQGFAQMMDTGLSLAQGNIELCARDYTSNLIDSSSKPDSHLIGPDRLATTIKCYGLATLRLKKDMPDQLGDVSQLESRFQTKDTGSSIDIVSYPSTMENTEIKNALSDAIDNKDLTETLYLISKIEILNRKMKLDQSLFRASKNGWYTVVGALMRLAPNLDSRDDEGRTAITHAALSGDFNTFQYLLDEGMYPNFMDKHSRSPLSYASEKGFLRIVKRLLIDARIDASPKDHIGRTPLSWATEGGHYEIVKLLLEHGVIVESNTSDDGQTPLSRAAREGHDDVVKLLLEHGAVVDSKDDKYYTPLSWAAKRGHDVVVKLLMEHGAHIDSRGDDDRTPLSQAAEEGHDAVVKLLLEHGAAVDPEGDRGYRMPLMWAVVGEHDTVVKLLLEYGADASWPDRDGQFPISRAKMEGNDSIVKLLEHALTGSEDK